MIHAKIGDVQNGKLDILAFKNEVNQIIKCDVGSMSMTQSRGFNSVGTDNMARSAVNTKSQDKQPK